MKPITFFALLIGLNLLLISCEGNTDRTREIRNNTSRTINVFTAGTYISVFNQSVSKNKTETLFITSQRGGSYYLESPAMGMTSMLITNATGDTCTKDYKLDNNWEIQVEERSKIPSDWQHKYTFVVDDSDFN